MFSCEFLKALLGLCAFLGVWLEGFLWYKVNVLELVKKGHVHYTDIEKKAVATCLRFATSNTIRKQFYHYLLTNGYDERISRGIYKITQKGEKLLETLDS